MPVAGAAPATENGPMPVAIVPAAGASRRMGRPKLLLPVEGGETVVGATVRPLIEGGAERVCLVIGPYGGRPGDERDARRLHDWALGRGLTVTVNPDPERGMLSSVLEGLEALGGADALADTGQILLVTPADLPGLRPSTVRALLRALTRDEARDQARARLEAPAPLAVPVVLSEGRTRRGHPLAIAPRLLPELAGLDLHAEGGLRQLLDRHPDEILEVQVDDPGCVHDVDTPEDYRKVKRPRHPG